MTDRLFLIFAVAVFALAAFIDYRSRRPVWVVGAEALAAVLTLAIVFVWRS